MKAETCVTAKCRTDKKHQEFCPYVAEFADIAMLQQVENALKNWQGQIDDTRTWMAENAPVGDKETRDLLFATAAKYSAVRLIWRREMLRQAVLSLLNDALRFANGRSSQSADDREASTPHISGTT